MKNAVLNAAKAWVAAVLAIVAAALPQVQDATNELATAIVGAIFAGIAVYIVPNKEPTE